MDPAIKLQRKEERLCECGAAGSGEGHTEWCPATHLDVVDEAMATRFLLGLERGLIDSRPPFNSDDIALVMKGLCAALQPS